MFKLFLFNTRHNTNIFSGYDLSTNYTYYAVKRFTAWIFIFQPIKFNMNFATKLTNRYLSLFSPNTCEFMQLMLQDRVSIQCTSVDGYICQCNSPHCLCQTYVDMKIQGFLDVKIIAMIFQGMIKITLRWQIRANYY